MQQQAQNTLHTQESNWGNTQGLMALTYATNDTGSATSYVAAALTGAA